MSRKLPEELFALWYFGRLTSRKLARSRLVASHPRAKNLSHEVPETSNGVIEARPEGFRGIPGLG